MSAQTQANRMTAEAFIAWSRSLDVRHELIDGFPTRMMGESRAHSGAKSGLLRQLFRQLPVGSACRIFSDGMAVKINDHNVFEPDVMISCRDGDRSVPYVTDPVVVFEVLSPSTQSSDILVKAPLYRTLPSMTHVVIIDTKKEIAIVFEAGAGEAPEVLTAEAMLSIPLPGGERAIALAAVFEEARRQ